MVAVELRAWALKHHVGEDALRDLADMLGAGAQVAAGGTASEARVQSLERLAAPSRDSMLFRNNVGVLRNERGTPVRYGLANDSKALNQRIKSGDLIGWRRRLITPEMVGSTIAQFESLECKPEGWRYTGDEHEQAQQRWAALVVTQGGIARFTTGPGGME